MSELHHEKQKSPLLSCSGCPGFFIDNLDHVHNWVGCFYKWQWSNKTRWKRLCECENVKLMWLVSTCVAAILLKQKTQSLYIYIYPYAIIYSYSVNVNLMLICIELSELIIYCKYAWKF